MNILQLLTSEHSPTLALILIVPAAIIHCENVVSCFEDCLLRIVAYDTCVFRIEITVGEMRKFGKGVFYDKWKCE